MLDRPAQVVVIVKIRLIRLLRLGVDRLIRLVQPRLLRCRVVFAHDPLQVRLAIIAAWIIPAGGGSG
jgi:hypothetical protein